MYVCNRVNEAETDYDETKRLADTARSKAQEAKQESLSVYSQSDSIRISRVNIESLDSESNQIKSDVSISSYFLQFKILTCLFSNVLETYLYNLYLQSYKQFAIILKC